ncbi:hypothetical protein CGRA01v4_11489 [Colletotrichum graminicola]|nr:hypothetical protein CGRA01v4_11489 [Colletotrichum graminicola]
MRTQGHKSCEIQAATSVRENGVWVRVGVPLPCRVHSTPLFGYYTVPITRCEYIPRKVGIRMYVHYPYGYGYRIYC